MVDTLYWLPAASKAYPPSPFRAAAFMTASNFTALNGWALSKPFQLLLRYSEYSVGIGKWQQGICNWYLATWGCVGQIGAGPRYKH